MEDKNQKLPSTRIQWVRGFYEKYTQTIENTGLLALRFLHIYINYSNLGGNIYDFEF